MKRLLATALTCVFFSQAASAENLEDLYRRQVTEYVDRSAAAQAMNSYGFQNKWLNVGYVVDSPGQGYEVTYNLQRGYVYAFVGSCDSDCADVDLVITGPNGIRMDDTAGDKNPSLWFFVAQDGVYRVRATVPKCNGLLGCYVAIKAMAK